MLKSEYMRYGRRAELPGGKASRLARLSAAVAIAMSCTLAPAEMAHAFDPQKVFKEDKPSFKEVFQFYFTRKKAGDEEEALDVLRYAADRGSQTARFKLGRMYEAGEGVPQDKREAFDLYKSIADNYGEARPNTPEWAITGSAMVALGRYYQTGIPEAGIPQDEQEARVMFTTSAMYFRDPDAQFLLGKMLLEDNPTFDEGRQAIRMLELARRKGHVGALALVGHALVQGEFVDRDTVRGLAMLTRASESAPPDLKPWIDSMHQRDFALASDEERRLAILKVQKRQ
jgi:TPR repeat protein